MPTDAEMVPCLPGIHISNFSDPPTSSLIRLIVVQYNTVPVQYSTVTVYVQYIKGQDVQDSTIQCQCSTVHHSAYSTAQYSASAAQYSIHLVGSVSLSEPRLCYRARSIVRNYLLIVEPVDEDRV